MNSNPGKSNRWTIRENLFLRGEAETSPFENTSVYNEQEKQWGRPVRHRALIGILAALAGLYFLDTVYKSPPGPHMYGLGFQDCLLGREDQTPPGWNPYGVTALGQVAQPGNPPALALSAGHALVLPALRPVPYPIAHMLSWPSSARSWPCCSGAGRSRS